MIREISYIRSEARDTTVTNDVTQRDARVRDMMSQTAKYQPMRRRAPIIMIASLCYTCNAMHIAHTLLKHGTLPILSISTSTNV